MKSLPSHLLVELDKGGQLVVVVPDIASIDSYGVQTRFKRGSNGVSRGFMWVLHG